MAVASRELPDFFYNAQDDHDAFTIGFVNPAYFSPAGAVGIMQVSPPSRPSQYCASCVQKAAELMGVKYEDIANDKAFQDVRTNVYIGVGYLIGKMAIQGGSWADLNAVNAAAGYYHGSGPGGQYANWVSTDVAACRALGPASGPTGETLAGGGSSCPFNAKAHVSSGTRANPVGGSGHCGIGYPTASSPWCSASRVANAGYISAVYAYDISPDSGGTNNMIYLPQVEGQNVRWTLRSTGDADGLGNYFDFAGVGENGTEYFTHIVHLQPSAMTVSQSYPSGTPISKLASIDGPHVHITMAKKTNDGFKAMDPPMDPSVCK
jgi:hypothetical protein